MREREGSTTSSSHLAQATPNPQHNDNEQPTRKKHRQHRPEPPRDRGDPAARCPSAGDALLRGERASLSVLGVSRARLQCFAPGPRRAPRAPPSTLPRPGQHSPPLAVASRRCARGYFLFFVFLCRARPPRHLAAGCKRVPEPREVSPGPCAALPRAVFLPCRGFRVFCFVRGRIQARQGSQDLEDTVQDDRGPLTGVLGPRAFLASPLPVRPGQPCPTFLVARPRRREPSSDGAPRSRRTWPPRWPVCARPTASSRSA